MSKPSAIESGIADSRVLLTARLTTPGKTPPPKAGGEVQQESLAQEAADCYQAGAAIVGLHITDSRGEPSVDLMRSRNQLRLIKLRAPVLTEVCLDTSESIDFERRLELVEGRPRLVSLCPGEFEFRGKRYANPVGRIAELLSRLSGRGIGVVFDVYSEAQLEAALRQHEAARTSMPLVVCCSTARGSSFMSTAAVAAAVRSLPQDAIWLVQVSRRASLELLDAIVARGGGLRVDDLIDEGAERGARGGVSRSVEMVRSWLAGSGAAVADAQEAELRLGLPAPAAPKLLHLATIGRRSGARRVTELSYSQEGGALVLAAGNGGLAKLPDWYRNLVANPDVEVRIGSSWRAMQAVVTAGPDRERLWERLTSADPGLAIYQRNAGREIPIIRLIPSDKTR